MGPSGPVRPIPDRECVNASADIVATLGFTSIPRLGLTIKKPNESGEAGQGKICTVNIVLVRSNETADLFLHTLSVKVLK